MRKVLHVTVIILIIGCSGEPLRESTDRLNLSYRVQTSQYFSEASVDSMMAFIRREDSKIRDFALFNFPATTFGIFDSAERMQMAALWKKRMQQFRDAGIPRVGFNIWYNLDFAPAVVREWKCPYRQSEDINGIANYAVCPNDTAYRKLYYQRYREYALAAPDFVFVDEGILSRCFCDVCLKKMGWTKGREALKKALNDSADCSARRMYMQFSDNTSNELAVIIRDAVHSVDPKIELGLMTIGYSNFNNNSDNFGRWMKTMDAVKGRPGHGFYHDKEPHLIINKYMDVTRQVRDYPAQVKDIEYELENWPHITLNKSVSTVINESTLAILAGCTGITYNIFLSTEGANNNLLPMTDYISLHREINRNAYFWNELIESGEGLTLTGFRTLDTIMLMGNRMVDKDGWFAVKKEYNINLPNEFMEYGFPLTTDPEGASGTLLSGKVSEAFSNEALLKILSGPCIIDQLALNVLWKKGLGRYTGVQIAGDWGHYYEVLTDNAMNGRYAGDGIRAEPYGAGRKLIPLSDSVQVLSVLRNYKGEVHCPCYTLYENELGGRIAVSSIDMCWGNQGRAGKIHQLKNVADWITYGKMPVKVNAFLRVAPFYRTNKEKNRFVLALFNCTFDKTGEFTVSVNAGVDNVKRISDKGKTKLKFDKTEDGIIIKAPSIDPWSILIVEGK